MSLAERLRRHEVLLELFVFGNISFLAVDIYSAHSMNRFRHPAEWIPFYFSIAATLVLLPGVVATLRSEDGGIEGRGAGLLVGVVSVLVGISGLIWHLSGHFFEHQTLRNLVYAAPFIAPLAYAGLGFLLLVNRMVEVKSLEWAQWILFMALGGFVGNFVLSLADHAQNGFFERTEWIPVVVSALGVGALATFFARWRDEGFRPFVWGVLALQLVTGLLGFGLHFAANIDGPGTMWERFVYGAPIFSPLLFADLAVLAAIAVAAVTDRGRAIRDRGRTGAR